MNGVISPSEAERFRNLVAQRLGLQIAEGRSAFLADVLRRRVEASGGACRAYLDRLEWMPTKEDIRFLARELTVGETYFFRHIDQFHAFVEVALPDRMRAQAAQKRVRLLSAGCASGDEAFSLAILATERISDPSWEVSILGLDINPVALERAERGRFSSWSLRETPSDIRHRWFRQDARDVVLDEAICRKAQFVERNLLDDDPALWQPESYDVIFCRNVIMYFTPKIAQEVVARLTRALAPGGYLFLGHAETLRGVSQDFDLRQASGTFYYQRRESLSQNMPRLSAVPCPTPPGPIVKNADSWMGIIDGARSRIQTLTAVAHKPGQSRTVSAPVTPKAGFGLRAALELIHRERFMEALEIIQSLPPEAAYDPDILLIHAVLLTHSGQLDGAAEACHQLLDIDEFNSGAHYLLALGRERLGDHDGAVDHDRLAACLDPSFAMPRLHLALLARRAADRDTARQELKQALALLQREDTSRLLLFGGGFSRDALIALCRAELIASEAKL